MSLLSNGMLITHKKTGGNYKIINGALLIDGDSHLELLLYVSLNEANFGEAFLRRPCGFAGFDVCSEYLTQEGFVEKIPSNAKLKLGDQWESVRLAWDENLSVFAVSFQ